MHLCSEGRGDMKGLLWCGGSPSWMVARGQDLGMRADSGQPLRTGSASGGCIMSAAGRERRDRKITFGFAAWRVPPMSNVVASAIFGLILLVMLYHVVLPPRDSSEIRPPGSPSFSVSPTAEQRKLKSLDERDDSLPAPPQEEAEIPWR